MTKSFFHDQPYDQVKHLTFKAAMRWFKKPGWCNCSEALEPLGCWGLTSGFVKNEDYCVNCEFNKRNDQVDEY